MSTECKTINCCLVCDCQVSIDTKDCKDCKDCKECETMTSCPDCDCKLSKDTNCCEECGGHWDGVKFHSTHKPTSTEYIVQTIVNMIASNSNDVIQGVLHALQIRYGRQRIVRRMGHADE